MDTTAPYRYDVTLRPTGTQIKIPCATIEEAAAHAIAYQGGSIKKRVGTIYLPVPTAEQYTVMDRLLAYGKRLAEEKKNSAGQS